MKIPAYALLGAVSLSLAHSQDFAPQTWFEDISISDQSVQKCYSFHTLPGVLYRVESSSNLVDWTQETELYGLGQNYTLAMHEVSPPTGGATSSTAETLTNVSVLARPSAGNSADLVISWPSLDHESPVTFLLSQASATGWNQLPLFSWLQGTYQFFIRFESSPATPPAETPTLGSLDSAMVAAFQTAIPSINEAIANSTALSRNTPVAAESGDRKFWRIRYDWTSDLDRDGTPDWAEFERLAAGGTVTVSNDAFDADSNGDGIKDGFQTDTDDDGTSDAEDIVLDDATATYAKHAQPLYALFPINNASPDPIYPSPFDINDKGTVLYANGTWTGGTWTPLAGYSNTEAPLIRAAYINDQGEIVGTRVESVENTSTAGNLAYWPDPKSAYQALSVNGDHPYIGSFRDSYPPSTCMGLSNSGQIIGFDQKLNPDRPYDLFGPYLWTLSGNGRTPGKRAIPLYEGGVLNALNYWGTEAGGNSWLFASGTKVTPPDPLRNITMGPYGELIVSFLFDRDTQVYQDGQWQTSKTYKNVLEVASDGTAIARKNNSSKAPLFLNGRWFEMDRYAPGAPQGWVDSSTTLEDISPGGWVLAKRPAGNNTETFGVLLPVTVDGIDSSVTPADQENLSGGVDRTSTTGLGGGGWVAEIWVMAPIGGTNTVRFRAPVNADSRLKLASDTATFSPATLQEKDIQVQVAGTGTVSQESQVTLKLGDELNSLSIPLRVKTMKRRTVKVALHRVHGLDKNGAETTPRFFPTKEGLESYLNKVYGRQTNTFFAVTTYDDPVVDFDTNNDGKLFIDTPDMTLATSNPKVATDEAHIDVWVAGGVSIIYFAENILSEQKVYGYTLTTPSRCIVDGDMANHGAPPDAEKPEFLLNTIAHEIGHVMTNRIPHPDDRKNNQTNIEAYGYEKMDPNIEKRLMSSGDVSGSQKPTALIKKEWDIINEWLTKLEENGKL